jgi:leucyl aminopeptidase
MERQLQSFFTDESHPDARPVHLVTPETLQTWLAEAPVMVRQWVGDNDFRPKPGAVCLLPDGEGALAGALLGVGPEGGGLRDLASLAGQLPAGIYRLESAAVNSVDLCSTGWGIGQYRFGRYLSEKSGKECALQWPEAADRADVVRAVEADRFVRDLVNTPASDMGPADLESAARDLAEEFGSKPRVIVGEDLLTEGFPAIHAVGRASVSAPRLIDFSWGDRDHPMVTLVGKGVCFDSGGLDIKPASAMRNMKKDMGGAAHVLGLARMIMAAELPVRLRVLVPAVENSISGNAYRPGDILATRKGLSVEIGNTDAEGRIVLCDALALADEESPELVINMATLTGAARVALGPELPALYSDDDDTARGIVEICAAEEDPVWHMPLWQPYAEGLSSPVADMNHISSAPMAGSIVAALYLKRFVESAGTFLHLDLFAWNPKNRPGRPEGAECQSVRGLFRFLEMRYGGGGD